MHAGSGENARGEGTSLDPALAADPAGVCLAPEQQRRTALQGHGPDGLAVKSTVELVSEVNRFHKSLATDGQGMLTAKLLPFGVYRVVIQQDGFAPFAESVEVRSAVPEETRNINNRLNLIDFAGLFSGNAIAPPRSYAIRLQASF